MDVIVDFEGLMERTMEDREVALEILECYLEETETSLELLGRACEANDLDECRERAHEIKGSSASAGILKVKIEAEKAQKEAENGDLERVKELYTVITACFDEASVEIKRILS